MFFLYDVNRQDAKNAKVLFGLLIAKNWFA